MLAIEEKEARDKKVMNEKTVWALLPTHMQAVLVLAAMCMHVSVLVFLAMGSSCFEQFDVNTAFSGPPLCAPAPQTAPTRAPRALRAAHVALPLSTFHPRPHCATSDMRACAVLVPPGCYACFRGPRVGTATGRSSSNPSVGSSSRYTSPRCCCSGSTSAGSAVLSPPLPSSPMRALSLVGMLCAAAPWRGLAVTPLGPRPPTLRHRCGITSPTGSESLKAAAGS